MCLRFLELIPEDICTGHSALLSLLVKVFQLVEAVLSPGDVFLREIRIREPGTVKIETHLLSVLQR